MSATVGLSVASSTSQKTGRAPRAAIAWAAATKLTVGSTTSSPGPRPSSSTAMNVADEHEFVAVTCSRATPRWRAKAASNSAVRAPRPTQLLSKTSRTAASSRSPSDGCTTLITWFIGTPRHRIGVRRPRRDALPAVAPVRGARIPPDAAVRGRSPRGPLVQLQQQIGGHRGVVAYGARPDHPLELRARDPAVTHVLLLVFAARRARAQPGGQEHGERLPAGAVPAVERAERGPGRGAQPGLLGQLGAAQLLRGAGTALREAALRELPVPPADRVAVLLHKVEAAVLGGDHHGVV